MSWNIICLLVSQHQSNNVNYTQIERLGIIFHNYVFMYFIQNGQMKWYHDHACRWSVSRSGAFFEPFTRNFSSVGRKTESESWKHRYPNCQENCYINSNKPVMLWGFILCGQIPKILVVKLLQQNTYYGIKNCCIMNLGEKTEETKGVLAHIAWTLTDTGHIW